MNATEILATLPKTPGNVDPVTMLTPRDVALIDLIKRGEHPAINWVPVPVSAKVGGKTITGTVMVSADCIAVGDEEDFVRINVGHVAAECIAIHFDAYLVTSRVEDFSFINAAVRIDVNTQDPTSHMADTSAMLKHHRDIEADRAGRSGLIRPVGKITPSATHKIDGKPTRCANYGLHFMSGPNKAGTFPAYQPTTYHAENGRVMRVWQPGPSTAHVSFFTDYSHVVILMKKTMIVDGVGEMSIPGVIAHDVYSWLISSEGPMTRLRHPFLAEPAAPQKTDPVIQLVESNVFELFPRTLRRTWPAMNGADVRELQILVGAGPDGWFGDETTGKLKLWQKNNGLDDDGVFGPVSRKVALAEILKKDTSPRTDLIRKDSIEEILASAPNVQHGPWAKNFTNVVRSEVHWIVLHSAEIAEQASSAEALASWAAGASAPQASWHYAIDNDSITQSVLEDRIAWHAPGANKLGVGYEHAGFARQSREEWLDDYSAPMLDLSARLAACVTGPRWGLPLDNFVDAAGLRKAYFEFHQKGKKVPNDLRGFTTHAEVTKSKIKAGSHVDPGKAFPIDYYMSRVLAAA